MGIGLSERTLVNGVIGVPESRSQGEYLSYQEKEKDKSLHLDTSHKGSIEPGRRKGREWSGGRKTK